MAGAAVALRRCAAKDDVDREERGEGLFEGRLSGNISPVYSKGASAGAAGRTEGIDSAAEGRGRFS